MSDETKLITQLYVQKGGDLVLVAESEDKLMWLKAMNEMVHADAKEATQQASEDE